MVHPPGREIGRVFFVPVPSVYEFYLFHVARLRCRCFVCIPETDTQGQFISFREIQPFQIRLAEVVVGEEADRASEADGTHSE